MVHHNALPWWSIVEGLWVHLQWSRIDDWNFWNKWDLSRVDSLLRQPLLKADTDSDHLPGFGTDLFFLIQLDKGIVLLLGSRL